MHVLSVVNKTANMRLQPCSIFAQGLSLASSYKHLHMITPLPKKRSVTCVHLPSISHIRQYCLLTVQKLFDVRSYITTIPFSY